MEKRESANDQNMVACPATVQAGRLPVDATESRGLQRQSAKLDAFTIRSCHAHTMHSRAHEPQPSHLIPVDAVPLSRTVRFLACRIDAGFPSPAADDLEEPIDLAAWLVRHPAASYVMRVQGWSMAGANISDGDHVVVDRSVEPRSGQIVVALVHGDRTLKRLRRRDGRLWLLPEPAAGHDFPETLVDEGVEVWGVVVGLARQYG